MDTQKAHQRLHALIATVWRSGQNRLIPATPTQPALAFEPLEGRMTLSTAGADTTSPTTPVFMTQNTRTQTAPSAPTSLSASDGQYATMIRVTWSPVPAATSYEVWRSEKNSPATARHVATVQETTYENTTVESCKAYFYWVKAINSAGTSNYSQSDVGYRTCPLVLPSVPRIPGTPQGVVASAGMFTKHVTVTWSSVPDAASYEIWRSNTTDLASAAKQADVTTNAYEDTTVRPIRQYFYWVRAKNSAGLGGFSDRVTGWKA